MDDIIARFIAAAIIEKQVEIVRRYRQYPVGAVMISMTRKDDRFMDLTERAICHLGFRDGDFPPIPTLDKVYSTAPLDDDQCNTSVN